MEVEEGEASDKKIQLENTFYEAEEVRRRRTTTTTTGG
jgi:hypothetical protein